MSFLGFHAARSRKANAANQACYRFDTLQMALLPPPHQWRWPQSCGGFNAGDLLICRTCVALQATWSIDLAIRSDHMT